MVKIHEEDIVVKYNPGTRARLWPDSVGIGMYYYVDIHASANTTLRSGSGQRVKPFQIPLRAMLTDNAPNFIAGAKNIGTTHISNGAYRLHPVEWNIGESAGALAAFALRSNVDPLTVGGWIGHCRSATRNTWLKTESQYTGLVMSIRTIRGLKPSSS